MADFLSGYTGLTSFRTLATPPVGAPRNVTESNITPTGFRLDWQAPTGGLPSGAVYVVSVSGQTDITTSSLTRTVSGLGPNSSYSYSVRVRASDNSLSGAIVGNIRTPAVGTPSNFIRVVGDDNDVRPTYTWDIGGSGFADSYDVFFRTYNPTVTLPTQTVTDRMAQIGADLEDGDLITIFVTAKYDGHLGPQRRKDFVVEVASGLTLTVAATAACLLGLNGRLDETFTISVNNANRNITPREVIQAAFGSGDNQIPLP